MNAEQFFNNGFGADVEKVHRKHVIDLMTNFAKHYHAEQCNIADVVGQSEQLVCDECGDTGRTYPTLAEPDGVECEKCKASEQLNAFEDLREIKQKIAIIFNTKDIENIEDILSYDDLGKKITGVLREIQEI